MATIIKLSQNEWVKFFLIQHGRIQDGCHHQVESEWMSEVFFVQIVGRELWVKFSFLQMVGTNLGKCEWVWEEKLRWLNPRWPPSSSWVRMNEFESDWISLSQSQSGGRVFLSESEKITRCLNPTWQCLNPTWQNSRWLPSSSWVRMNEWRFFCANGGNHSWQVLVSLRGKTKMFGCPHIFGWCLDAPCTYTTQRKDTLSDKGGVYMPPYICMPPVHKQHKESMLCQTKGVSICPHRFRCHHMLGYHLYVGMPPLCLDAAICLDAPPVCLNATLCLNTPICLDTPVCLNVPICLDTFICLDAHLYVWTYPICLHSPYVWMPLYVWVPPIFGHPSVWLDIPHVWTSPVCLDVLHMFGFPLCVWMWASKHMGVSKCIRGIQTYRGLSKHMGASIHIGSTNMDRDIQTYGRIQTYRWPSKHMGASKHTVGAFKNIGPSKQMGVSKHGGGHPNM